MRWLDRGVVISSLHCVSSRNGRVLIVCLEQNIICHIATLRIISVKVWLKSNEGRLIDEETCQGDGGSLALTCVRLPVKVTLISGPDRCRSKIY
ncbi:hypothetical protein E2C01_077519 [Portunus trituberculatus]|uniref:Uncharacterized protein n=1 Tax=Portunus trituberculatus TaxID=210409 RepID=A0A5B7IKF5_PORTR|nr:hypothetical protein [Portunus trituberculatus]